MEVIKKIFLSSISIFLIWQSYELISKLHEVVIHSWAIIILVAWTINMFVTGIFAFSGFAFPTQKLLPPGYYEIRHPARLKQVFQWLGVEWFRRALLHTLWKSEKQRKGFFDGKKTSISMLEEQSTKSEFGHTIPFVIICLLSIYLLALGLNKLGLCTLLINIIGNLYPVILQRHHRMRIQAIMGRRNRP